MVLAKGNQKSLLKEIRGHFASQSVRPADFATRSPQPEHGRIEQREIWVSTDPVHRISFPWVEQVFMIKRVVREYRCARNGKPAKLGQPSVEIVYGITSHTHETAGAEALLAFNRRTGRASASTGSSTTPRRGTRTGAGSGPNMARRT